MLLLFSIDTILQKLSLNYLRYFEHFRVENKLLTCLFAENKLTRVKMPNVFFNFNKQGDFYKWNGFLILRFGSHLQL